MPERNNRVAFSSASFSNRSIAMKCEIYPYIRLSRSNKLSNAPAETHASDKTTIKNDG